MEDYGLRLPVGKSTDRSPHIDRIVNIGLGSRLLSNPASDLGRAAGRPSKDVQRRGHDPPDDPRLSPQARPAFERPGERLLCRVLGRLSPSGEAIRHAVYGRERPLVDMPEVRLVKRQPSTILHLVKASRARPRLTSATAIAPTPDVGRSVPMEFT
jgi:hypothetical protein